MGWRGGAADISLLCKCSFPHKQRGVQNGRVERGESIACAFVSASPINSSPIAEAERLFCVRTLRRATGREPSAGGAPSASRRNKPPAARGNQK